MDKNSLSHTTWECKYHLVFALKYRRQIIYGKLKGDIEKILRELCERKGVEIIEAECCKDHIHIKVFCEGKTPAPNASCVATFLSRECASSRSVFVVWQNL